MTDESKHEAFQAIDGLSLRKYPVYDGNSNGQFAYVVNRIECSIEYVA